MGVGIDTTGRAARVWESLGVGFIEIGPITEQPVPSPMPIARDPRTQGMIVPDVPVNPGLDVLSASLSRTLPLHVPLAVRLAYRPDVGPEDAAREQRGLARRLAPEAALFTLDWTRALGPHPWGAEAWSAYLATIDPRDGAVWAGRAILAAIPPDADPSILCGLLAQAIDSGIQGIVVGDGLLLPDGRRHVGPVALSAAVATVRTVRAVLGDSVPVVAAGGITNPADALPLMDVGANAVEVTSGLVYAGPALPRRIGDTILAVRSTTTHSSTQDDLTASTHKTVLVCDGQRGADGHPHHFLAFCGSRWWHEDWPWAALLGAGMVVAGTLAWLVAIIRVVLPYDETFLGLSRAQMEQANRHLLSFMALVALGVGFLVGGVTIATVGVTDVFVREDLSYLHTTASALRAANPHLVPLIAHDRAGFGGALVSDGVAFLLVALWGIRRGARWIWWTLLLAGLPGFVATIGIHLAVGYDTPVHLAPVGLALMLWIVGLALCHGYCQDVKGTSASGQRLCH